MKLNLAIRVEKRLQIQFLSSQLQYKYIKKHKTLYACFVDFAKAFDLVKHKLLWNKLAGMGVSTNILNKLTTIYVWESLLQSHCK